MIRNEHMVWQETSDSRTSRDCGCAEGAWLDALGHCQECGEGITCKGMGEVVVLPGFFASADRAGFVWRCYGADWARCPGGSPGSCAEGRLNTSTACEECEPYTRMTNDGPCKARCGLLVVNVCGISSSHPLHPFVLTRKEKAVVAEQRIPESTVQSRSGSPHMLRERKNGVNRGRVFDAENRFCTDRTIVRCMPHKLVLWLRATRL